MTYSLFYDQVLTELMSGTFQDGINLLVGMLDNVSRDDATKQAAGAALRDHDLDTFLAEHPFYRTSNDARRRAVALNDLFCGHKVDDNISTTGRRLLEATSHLTFARAVRQRRECTTKSLTRAWRAGQRICVLGEGQMRALGALAGQDLSNVTLIEQDAKALSAVRHQFGPSLNVTDGDLSSLNDNAGNHGLAFDLVCAGDLPDGQTQAELAALLGQASGHLKDNGKIQLASFAPCHLGFGWREIGLRWDMHCYDEGQWQDMGAQAGLQTRTCRDVSNSVVWSEFTKNSEMTSWGAQSHGH